MEQSLLGCFVEFEETEFTVSSSYLSWAQRDAAACRERPPSRRAPHSFLAGLETDEPGLLAPDFHSHRDP